MFGTALNYIALRILGLDQMTLTLCEPVSTCTAKVSHGAGTLVREVWPDLRAAGNTGGCQIVEELLFLLALHGNCTFN